MNCVPIRVDRTIDRIRLRQTPVNIYQGFCRPVQPTVSAQNVPNERYRYPMPTHTTPMLMRTLFPAGRDARRIR
jgi:hypothetical protein